MKSLQYYNFHHMLAYYDMRVTYVSYKSPLALDIKPVFGDKYSIYRIFRYDIQRLAAVL